MKVDSFGHVILDAEELFSALYRGEEISGVFASGEEIERYNALCQYNDKSEFILLSPPLEGKSNSERRQEWALPDEYRGLDVWLFLDKKCKSDEERARLREEKVEYEARDLSDLLRLMVYLVANFRERGIVWGVGRGSSVASLALYLIGITKINPMLYGLEIGDFLKD